MLELLGGFVEELRGAGIPVSLGEAIDAAEAAVLTPLSDRRLLRAALGATLVKSEEHWPTFSTLFDVWFSSGALEHSGGEGGGAGARQALGAPAPAGEAGEARRLGDAGAHDAGGGAELRRLAVEALGSGDERLLAELARLAVAFHAGIEPGRPVGASYYLYRTLRALDLDVLRASLLGSLLSVESGADAGEEATAGVARRPTGSSQRALASRLRRDEIELRIEALRRLLEAEIRRALVRARGPEALSRALRRPLLEDVDFAHASAEELSRMRRALYPLARQLASRLARRRRHRRHGSLDFRSTIRHSLSSGGVPLEPRFRRSRPAKPEIVVLADVSGSVAAFARFTLHLVYAISSQFSKVRTFVFVDGVDEVTGIFARSATISEAVERVASEADVVHLDGHSDYGHAFSVFAGRWADSVGPRTSLLVLGDARSNYHPANVEALERVASRARRVWWLNPEPRAYWGSGDSIVEQYGRLVDGMFECRTIRQLERVVAQLD